ncbi:putative Zn peptidase [Methyloglobulus morosus KoM1]|uniref:Putative Zn peptidase n=1 Tax=Methyloglobulus morosus KoM1 TaxID=1116472 RepID=V5BJC4_9GAMM|nr:XRE family transcriptional regulator [Methyloglobulus morosus]ESS66222.1 putative Zn peptidase [Methyloglobulus morosus KoM1]
MKMKADNAFYGDKLRLARLLNGLTQQQLGDVISASRQFVHQMESGIRPPAADVLNALCESLQVKDSFFADPVGNDVKFEQCHFRKRKTTPVGIANRVLAFSTIFEQLVAYINEYLQLPTINFPVIDHSSSSYSNSEIELAAEECRKMWGLGLNTPIAKMTRVLENAGVVITQFKGVSEKVDALSLNRKFPIIVRNDAKESVCRMRFDLAHECGHFVLHDGVETGDLVTESEANKFASAFLFPRATFINEFTIKKDARLNWNLIYQLKKRWGMSAKAILYRAHHLDLISAQQYRSGNVHLSKTNQSKKEDHDEDIQPETPELLINALEILKNQLGISFNHIADYLGVEPSMLSAITGVYPENEEYLKNVTPIFG